jgi:hypothetical protein
MGLDHCGEVALPSCGRGFGLLPRLGPLRFIESTFLSLFRLFLVFFLHLYQIYWYKWKHISSTGVCVYEYMFSSFLELCWRYKYVNNDHQ